MNFEGEIKVSENDELQITAFSVGIGSPVRKKLIYDKTFDAEGEFYDIILLN